MKYERLVLPQVRIEHLAADINKVFDDAEKKKRKVHILVEPERISRSTGERSQNHHLNGHIQQIAQGTGQPFDDVKRYVKQMAIDMGYPMLTRGQMVVTDLWGKPLGISEADADTAQCAILIEASHQLAAEMGIILRETDYEYF